MSQTANLKAEKRTDSGKGVARKLRAGGRAPAVVYGQGEDALLLSIDALETMNLFNHISVENTIVELVVDGEPQPIPTLVREVQLHPYKSELIHVDFYKIQAGVEVEVTVPLHVHGDAPGVKFQGGILQQVEHDLPVRSIPSMIPEDLTVDISGLEIGDQITAGELEIPEGVTLLLEDDQPVVLVSAPRPEEEEEEELEEAAEPELVGEEGETDESESEPEPEEG
ncbi:MAG: 50S ribosomal protein L25 [Gemmatimonadota bacterium]